jgi:ABC-type Fe3+/spermidine/putrescine transport system ATPase subunit
VLPSPALELAEVEKRYGDLAAVAGVSLALAPGELFGLLGPSGCGKSTLLRLVAGLEAPDRGRVHLAGRDVTAEPAHRRRVHTVFQHYALFPHLTVAENVGFGLRYQPAFAGLGRRARRTRERAAIDEALELVRLAGLGHRLPSQLSGGQRQRVALARALVLRPEVLLLDEPLGALDRELRETMQEELRALQRRLGICFLFVTHDQDEALALADRIGVMQAGRLVQVGTPAEVWERPRTTFVARFLGAPNRLPARLLPGTSRELLIAGRARVAASALTSPVPSDRAELLCTVRPERLRLSRRDLGPRGLPSLEVELGAVTYQGARRLWTARTRDGLELRVVVPADGEEGGRLVAGELVYATWRPQDTLLLDDDEPPGLPATDSPASQATSGATASEQGR